MIATLIGFILVVIFLVLAFGPLESLGWWRDKGATQVRESLERLVADPPEAGEDAEPSEHYVVYLSGIGAIDPTTVPPEELPLVEQLRERLPTFCIADDVFPYSVANRGLTAQRALAGLWRRLENLRLANPGSVLGMLVNARNAIQLFVCADRRYGPTYNIGTAQQILGSLLRHGYRPGSGIPVTLIGWSGGAQISIGACWYLGMLDLPLRVISLGGMMADDYGLDRIQKLTHLRGSKDPLERLGWILFAGRWPGAVGSPWSRAKAEGRIDVVTLGPMHHNDKAHYFDPDTVAPDGRSYLQVSVDAIHSVLVGDPIVVIEQASASPEVDRKPDSG